MTAPLTPSDCDLSDFQFMPLDVARLRDSELAAGETPEACWAAVLLWAASWHQIPAASVPDDDKWLAKAAGYGRVVKEWARVREGALRGFVRCDDGRLYHSVVAEKARDAWGAKLAQRWRTEIARIKKHNDRHHTTIARPTYEEWISLGRPQGHPLPVPGDKPPCHPDVPDETASKRQGEGQGQGDSSSVPIGTDGADAPADGGDQDPKDPPPDPVALEDQAKAELWRAAVSVLEHGGCPASQCRTFMGKLVGDYTLPIVKQAVAAAVTAHPAEAREYLIATCQRLKGERRDPVTVPLDPAVIAAAAATKAAEAAHAEKVASQTPEQRAAVQARLAKARAVATGVLTAQGATA